MQPHNNTWWKLAGAAGAVGLALMAIAATIATSAKPEKSVWTHNPTMYLAYGFLAIAVVLGAQALGIFGRMRAWGRALWSWVKIAMAFIPYPTFGWHPPGRRIRLPGRKRDTEKRDRSLIAAGRMGERLSSQFDIGEPELTPNSVRWKLGSKSREGTLAKIAAGQAEPPPSLPEAAAGDGLTPSQRVYEESHREREKVLARSLRQQGEGLHSELYSHADKARSNPFFVAVLPKVYLGQVQDWNGRFLALAERHLTPKDRFVGTAIYPPWLVLVGNLGNNESLTKAVEGIDEMFRKNLATLSRIETKLGRAN